MEANDGRSASRQRLLTSKGPSVPAMKRILAVLAVAVLGLSSATAFSQAAPISRFARFVGHINTVATGGALRDQPNTGNACSLGNNPSSNALAGIPACSPITAALP